ncbi:hypothetical protein PV10_08849 [Exophiala mesophila]|uniref:Uncharacterized protein n=1 Tax=Exophiala mesophila TaxID=212818 RepID=A0A0D1WK23_EXOME|nr:uncharacterized protein PV10_08849 [Exophiala mesophila]KIV89270.1 hypothetical protein PV10_08849 [Exophiala mesophila]
MPSSTSKTDQGAEGTEALPPLEETFMVGSPGSELEFIDTLLAGPINPQLPMCNMQVFPIHDEPNAKDLFPYLGACISLGKGCIVTREFLQFAYQNNTHNLNIEPIDPLNPDVHINIMIHDSWGKQHTIEIAAKSKIPFLLKSRRSNDKQPFLFRLNLPCLVTAENCSILPGPTSAKDGVVMWIGCGDFPPTGMPGNGITQVSSTDWLVQCDHRREENGDVVPHLGPYYRIRGCPDEVLSENASIHARGGIWGFEGDEDTDDEYSDGDEDEDSDDSDDSTETIRPGHYSGR